MRLFYYGHSTLQIEHQNYSILIDPLIRRNPCSDYDPKDVQADHILLTHGHHDHFGDTLEIAKQNDAWVIAPYEMGIYLRWKGLKTHPMGIGGSMDFDFGKVTLTYARHSSGLTDDESGSIMYMGSPCGYLLTLGEKTLYFAGDTALFYEMKLIGERYDVDVAFLPIGDNYTMGPDDALLAADWIQAKKTVPIHYNSFPFLDQDPYRFVSDLEKRGRAGYVLKPNTALSL